MKQSRVVGGLRGVRRWVATLAVCAAAGAVQAATDSERLAELERKYEALSLKAEQQEHADVIPAVGASAHGLGPAASKVYYIDQGLSLGGYGEAVYQNFDGSSKTDEWDFLRAVLYVGYKYNDKLVINTEIEVEHADEVFLEFATVDYLHRPELNLRAGLVLIPMGLLNEMHEPTTFHTARRPSTEQAIIPSTWRENGAGVFGETGVFSYKAYVVNGMRGEDFTSAGLRGGRQKASQAAADDLAFVARLDVRPSEGLLIGASGYYGDSGQSLGVAAETTLVEAHVDWQWRGLQLRGLIAHADVEDVAELNRLIATAADPDGLTPADSDIDSIGEEMDGWYAEAAYDLFAMLDKGEQALNLFTRYEEYDTQAATPAGFKTSGANDVEVVTVGVNYKPIDEIVVKLDHQFVDNAAGTGVDQTNVALGYVF